MVAIPLIAKVGGVATIELLPAAAYEAAYTPGAPVIGFAFEAQAGTHAFASDRKRPFQAKPNHLSFVPARCDVYSCSAQRRVSSHRPRRRFCWSQL